MLPLASAKRVFRIDAFFPYKTYVVLEVQRVIINVPPSVVHTVSSYSEGFYSSL